MYQEFWQQAAKDFQLELKYNFSLEIDGTKIAAPVLIKNLGGKKGMLISPNGDLDKIVTAGYGYCLNHSQEYEKALCENMLKDWGWE